MGKYCYVASAGRHARRWGVDGERRVAGHFVSPRAQLIEDYNRLLPDALTPRLVKRPGDLDLLTLKVVSESRDLGYLSLI